jgi:hypothetical protein
MSWGFGLEEAPAASDSAVGFDDDGFRVAVYKLEDVSELGFEGG